MRIGQQVVTGGQKYSFPMPNANNNFVIFDIHNDSPYNVGVSLGVDSGINNCDYYTSPHGAIFGVSPFGANRRSIGGAKWNGTIFVYTEVPAGGGGTTNLASAPASSVTVLGYPQGYQPQAQIALNRMQTTANTVQTASNVSATSLTNDNNAAGTSIIEATQVGSPGSNVSILNDGTVTIADWASLARHILLEIIPGQTGSNPSIVALANTSQLMEIIGNLYIQGASLHLNNRSIISINDASGSQANILTVDSIGNTILQAHSTNNQVVIWDKNGAVLSTIDFNGCLNMTGQIQTVNGDTSGSMTIQEIFSGGSKWVIVKQNNYRQNGAAQQLVLKNTFTGPFLIINMGCGGMQVLNGASVQSGNYLSSIAATGGGFTAETAAAQCTIGWNNTAIDRVQSQGAYASAHTGVFILAGF